jgi:hypothetical protein
VLILSTRVVSRNACSKEPLSLLRDLFSRVPELAFYELHDRVFVLDQLRDPAGAGGEPPGGRCDVVFLGLSRCRNSALAILLWASIRAMRYHGDNRKMPAVRWVRILAGMSRFPLSLIKEY